MDRTGRDGEQMKEGRDGTNRYGPRCAADELGGMVRPWGQTGFVGDIGSGSATGPAERVVHPLCRPGST